MARLTITCEKCGGIMTLKKGRYGDFYGCSNYWTKKCKNTKKIKEVEALMQLMPSDEQIKDYPPSRFQAAIYNFWKNTTKNLLVRATAGSGKTYTLIQLIKFLPPNKSNIFLAFNKDIVSELGKKLKSAEFAKFCQFKTLHSLSFRAICRKYGKVRVVDKNNPTEKLDIIFNNYIDSGDVSDFIIDILKQDKRAIFDLVSKIKNYLLDVSLESIAYLADRHNIILNGDSDIILNAVSWIYYQSLEDKTFIDFDDMLILGLECNLEKFDNILVDEGQDLNPLQLRLIELSLKSEGRLAVVGDDNQSIYAFRGADLESMEKIREKFNCEVLPLSISYRCPKVVGRLVNETFPHIDFEIPDSAIEGILEYITTFDFTKLVKDGDLVLCRNNAPLVKQAFSLIREGRKVIIKGRDIGLNLINFILKIQRKYNAENLTDFIEGLNDYIQKETDKLERIGRNMQVDFLLDQRDSIMIFADGASTINEIIQKIDDIFSDYNTEGVTFSSIHKAKGLESDNVFILDIGLIPSKHAKQDFEIQQEENLKFVAYTRAKKSLRFFDSDN